MNYRSNKDSMPNPTFEKLLERAKKYQALLEQQNNDQQVVQGGKNAATQPAKQTPQAAPTAGPANTAGGTGGAQPAQPAQPTPKQDSSKENTNDGKDISYVCNMIASYILDLLQGYYSNSPSTDPKVPGLDGMKSAKTMGQYIEGAKQAFAAIDHTIQKDPDSAYYKDFTNAKDSALNYYIDALSKYQGYDQDTDIQNTLNKDIDPQITALENRLGELAASHKAPDANPPVAQAKPAEQPVADAAGFGDFANFKTYESFINEELDTAGEDEDSQTIADLNAKLKLAHTRKDEGKDKASERVRRKIFTEISDGCEDLMGRVNAVRNKIRIGRANPNQKDLKSFDMEDSFVKIATDAKTLRDQLNTGDKESLESVDRLVKNFSSKLKTFNGLEKKFYDSYNQELTTREKEDLNPDAFNLITQGNTKKDEVLKFSITSKKSELKATENGAPAKTTAPTPASATGVVGGLKINAPIPSGIKKDPKTNKAIVDPNVKSFQQLVIDKFPNANANKNSKIFKEFMSKGADGYFGRRTAAIVAYLQAGFGLSGNIAITQDLINKLQEFKPEMLKESVVFRFDNFLLEQFDQKAADAKLAKYDSGELVSNKPKDDKIKEAPKKDNKKYTGQKPQEPTIPTEKVKNAIGEVTDEDKKKYREMYVKLGAKPIDEKGRMAVAQGKGILFYSNGKAQRTWDKTFGDVDMTSKKFTSEQNKNDSDDLNYLVNHVVPEKYSKVTEIVYNLKNGKTDATPDINLFFKRIAKWEKYQIQCLSFHYTDRYKRDLYNDLKNLGNNDLVPTYWKNKYPGYAQFMETMGDTLSEYSETLKTQKVEKDKEEEDKKVDQAQY